VTGMIDTFRFVRQPHLMTAQTAFHPARIAAVRSSPIKLYFVTFYIGPS
jgi:hypothetical protein